MAVQEETGESQAVQLKRLEEVIKTYITNLENSRQQLKTQREMFDDVFENDPTYKSQTEAVKEASKVRLVTRQQIMKQPSVAAMNEKIKDLRFDIKDQETALSDYLQQFQQLSGATEIEDSDGEMRQIVSVVRVVKR